MMQKITYTIRFFSYWHCGSGLSAGATLDELVIKDKKRMPFIPGRTIKGLVREAAENYLRFSGKEELIAMLDAAFGLEASTENIGNMGCMHFENAVLSEKEYLAIVNNNAQDYLYEKLTSTAIGKNGVAKDFSLRSIEVTVPCTLCGTIMNVPEQLRTVLVDSLGLIKRIGQKRNRGLGRCDVKEGGQQ